MDNLVEKLTDLARNEEILEKINNCKSFEEGLTLLKEYGIDATEDALKEALISFNGNKNEEELLDERELEKVTGGTDFCYLKGGGKYIWETDCYISGE